jgi:hypothetical protein
VEGFSSFSAGFHEIGDTFSDVERRAGELDV